VLALTCLGVARFWPSGRGPAWPWYAGAAALALMFGLDLADLVTPEGDPDGGFDMPSALGWAAACLALLIVFTRLRPSRAVRLIFLAGFAAQSLALAAELLRLNNAGAAALWLMPLLYSREALELLSLSAYCLALGLVALSAASAFFTSHAAPAAGLASLRRLGKLPGRLIDSGAGRRLRIAVEDLRFAAWRRDHPGGDFAAYYVWSIGRSLAAGQPHRTLGIKRWSRANVLEGAGAWSARSFPSRGRAQFEELLAAGLQRHHRCLDYGCGSLRVGQHLIRHLDAGNYIGLDVTDRFYRDGLALIEPALIGARRPHLAVIGERELAVLESDPPDFLVCVSVLMHVPPDELAGFLQSLLRCVGPHTVVKIHADLAARQIRTAPKSWAYAPEQLFALIRGLSGQADLQARGLKRLGSIGGVAWHRSVLTITNRTALPLLHPELVEGRRRRRRRNDRR